MANTLTSTKTRTRTTPKVRRTMSRSRMPLAPRPSKSKIIVSGAVYCDVMSLLSYDRYCAEILAQAELLTSVVQGADMTSPVPSCPDWNVGQLLRHLGGVHRWAATIVRTQTTEPVQAQ